MGKSSKMLDFNWISNLKYLRFYLHHWYLFIGKEFKIMFQSSRKKREGNKRYSLHFCARKIMLSSRKNVWEKKYYPHVPIYGNPLKKVPIPTASKRSNLSFQCPFTYRNSLEMLA